jgi:hypothetical protein
MTCGTVAAQNSFREEVYKMPTQEQELEKILSELGELKKEVSSLKKQRDGILLKESQALSKIEDRFDDLDSWVNVAKTLQDVPGLRSPKWYKVEIPFTFGDKQSKFSSVQVSATGPFICTQLQAYYRITDTTAEHYTPHQQSSVVFPTSNAAGRMIQATAYNAVLGHYTYKYKFVGRLPARESTYVGNLFSSYDRGSGAITRYAGWNFPDFDISIELANSNRKWTGIQRIPSAALYGVYGPLHLGCPGLVKSADSLVVHAMPTTDNVHLSGVFTLEFHGYQIGSNVDPEMLEGL